MSQIADILYGQRLNKIKQIRNPITIKIYSRVDYNEISYNFIVESTINFYFIVDSTIKGHLQHFELQGVRL